MTRLLAIASTVVLALIGTACGGASEPTATTTTIPTVAVAESTAEPDATAVVPVNADSPIESLLGVPIFDEDATNAWFRELEIERQRLTAQCMITEGFEYVPETTPQAAAFEVEFATDSREYAVAYGFGIGHSFTASEYDPNADYSTANSKYLASLSEGETQAYLLALQGPQRDESEGFDGPPESGCAGEAFQEIFSVVGVMFGLEPVFDGYYEQFIADSRMIELNQTWQQCMSESGYLFAHPDDMEESFFPELDRLLSQAAIFEPVEIPRNLAQPDDFFGDNNGLHPKLTPEGQVQMDDFIANEVATAVAHWDCHQPLLEDELTIQREYEAKFVAEVGPSVREQLGE